MDKCGIICEYDPFHNGHKYHLQKTKELTGSDIVCVMSGDFTQRARPAFFDKYLRAEAALKCGADAVIELPVVYSTAPAEVFAYGAVKILSKIKDLKYLSFGVETDDLDTLKKIAALQADEPQEMKDMMRTLLKQGLSYPNCFAEASAAFLNNIFKINDNLNNDDGFKKHNRLQNHSNNYNKEYILEILSAPNNVLAIEYLKAIARLKLDIKPVFIKRIDSGFKSRDLIPPYASATAIRGIIESGADYSAFVPFNFGQSKLDFNLYNSLLRLALLQNSIPPTEGLEIKLKKAAQTHMTLSETIEAAKSKRYTYSRINRLIFRTMSGINNELLKYNGDFFYKVPGIRESFKSSLKDLGGCAVIKTSDKPYINQTAEDILEIDKKASDIYCIITDAPASRFYNKLKII